MAVSPEHMTAWRLFLEAHAAIVRRLERELLEQADLALSWYDMLVQLQEAGGSMRMGELADRLLISRSATTRFVDRVEKAGYVAREASEADGRGMNVVLTEDGFRRLKDAAPTHLRGIRQHFESRLSPDEAIGLAELLRKLAP